MRCEHCGQVRRARTCGNPRCRLSWPSCTCTHHETLCTTCRAGQDVDPIAELWWSLLREGRPSLEWSIRWGADGEDPVASAWNASKDIFAMVNILRLAGDRWMDRLRALRIRSWTESPEDQTRRVIPVPPTLDELFTALQQRRHRSVG